MDITVKILNDPRGDVYVIESHRYCWAIVKCSDYNRTTHVMLPSKEVRKAIYAFSPLGIAETVVRLINAAFGVDKADIDPSTYMSLDDDIYGGQLDFAFMAMYHTLDNVGVTFIKEERA